MKKIILIIFIFAQLYFAGVDAFAVQIKNEDRRSYILDIYEDGNIRKVKIDAKGFINLGDKASVMVKLYDQQVAAAGSQWITIYEKKLKKGRIKVKDKNDLKITGNHMLQ